MYNILKEIIAPGYAMNGFELFWLTFQIAVFTFGGGIAMVPLLRQNLTAAGLLSARESIDLVALSEMAPGPFAVNAAVFAGMRIGGFPGAVFAALGIIAPSVILMSILALALRWVYKHELHKRPETRLVLSCLRAVVLGLIAATAIDFGREALLAEGGVFGGVSLGGLLVSWPAATIAAGTFLALRFRKAGPVLCIALSGAAGALVLR